jgi:hypothetical protein
MLAVILAVAFHTITCFLGGSFFCHALALAPKETGWNNLTAGEKLRVLYLLFMISTAPVFCTSLLVWYAIHKMV